MVVEKEERKIGDVAVVEIQNVVEEEAKSAMLEEGISDYQKWNRSLAQQSSTAHSFHRIVRMVQCDVVVVERLHRLSLLPSPHNRGYQSRHHHGCCDSLVVVRCFDVQH